MEQRLERLESLYALQERSLEELNEVLTGQQAQLDEMARSIRILAEKMRQLAQAADQGDLDDAPPPHYGR